MAGRVTLESSAFCPAGDDRTCVARHHTRWTKARTAIGTGTAVCAGPTVRAGPTVNAAPAAMRESRRCARSKRWCDVAHFGKCRDGIVWAGDGAWSRGDDGAGCCVGRAVGKHLGASNGA